MCVRYIWWYINTVIECSPIALVIQDNAVNAVLKPHPIWLRISLLLDFLTLGVSV
jgi:hypothetical protein